MSNRNSPLARLTAVLILAVGLNSPRPLPALQTTLEPQRLIITARDYRATFQRYRCELQLELRDGQGQWRTISKRLSQPEFALTDAAGVHSTLHSPARLRHAESEGRISIGITSVLPSSPPTIVHIDMLCTDDGLLMRFVPDVRPSDADVACWPVPRIGLDETLFDAYSYWRAPDELHAGPIAGLGSPPAYAGASPWSNHGDTAARLSARHPALIARNRTSGLSLGVVLVDYESRWTSSRCFLQQHALTWLYFYPAIASVQTAVKGNWAWLAPLPADGSAAAAQVERLLAKAGRLTAQFRSIAPEPEAYWRKPVPDFPAALRRARPVEDIREAIVYTMNELIESQSGIDEARKTGSDVLVRAWFKWHNSPDWRKFAPLVPNAHELGALFGGGITCSALYDGENGLSQQHVLDMATRGPKGELIDAWKEPSCRHGTLSNPAYLQYLLSWCGQQIDAGADYLFMDEIDAALHANEGFDNYSIADFREFLRTSYGKQGWTPTDARWQSTLKIDLADRAIAPDGTMGTFQYRAYLKSRALTANPHAPSNPLSADWHYFRRERDDRAWKWLTDAIRAYAAAHSRRVLLSGNGLAPYVDLQVLGVWGDWRVTNGRVDLSEDQIQRWASIVGAGRALAGKPVPVVLFHDWGFGGFPWMEVPPEDRRLWMRVRGAEIYAAGGFFAFPVRGPFGNDSHQDGTLPEVARQSMFYHQHQELYLDAQLAGFEPLESREPALSLALWRRASPPSLMLHVINRLVDGDQLRRRGPVSIELPTGVAPRAVRCVSPDWSGEKSGKTQVSGDRLTVTVPELEAYVVAILDYDTLPALRLCGRRVVPSWHWVRPERNEFVVQQDGIVRDAWALPGTFQGMLHKHLRNPPTFVVNMPRGGQLRVHVRAVARAGARLRWQVDGRIERTIDLPDRDGKNEATAREYDQTFELPIPPGRHRLGLDNVGDDWATIDWYAFAGETRDP